MPRTLWNDGQEIVYPDLSSTSSRLEIELYERLIYELMERQQNVVFSSSFFVSYTNSTHVSVGVGNGVQLDNTKSDPEPKARLLYLASAAALAITTPHATLNRIDLVCIKANRASILNTSRNVKDAISGIITSTPLDVETDWLSDVQIVPGTPGGSPVAPATPSGWVPLAQLLVTAVSGMSGQSAITDVRPRYKKPSAWSPSRIETTSFVLDLDDCFAVCNPVGPINVTLPDPTLCAGKVFVVKNISTQVVTMIGTIDGQTNPQITAQWTSLSIRSDGTQFYFT